jgi:selenocysteine lyase/cysteine desulfurase
MAAAACEASKGEFVPAESDGVVYLDSAGKTQLPLSVLEVGEKALKRKV